MKQPVIIRAQKEHVDIIVGMFLSLHGHHVEMRPDFFSPVRDELVLREEIAAHIENKTRIFYIAFTEGVPCAYLEGSLSQTESGLLYCPRLIARIENLYTLPSFRCKGIASALVKKFCQYAQTNGFENLELDVLGANSDALAFYRKLGFAEQKIRMEKTISLKEEEYDVP